MKTLALCLSNLWFAATVISAADVVIQVGNPAGLTDPEKLQFNPKVSLVNPGDNVTFVFNGNHSVTQETKLTACTPGSPNGDTPFDSGILTKGSTFSLPASVLVPNSIIYYFCKVGNGKHCNAPNFMEGSLVVSDGTSIGNSTATGNSTAIGNLPLFGNNTAFGNSTGSANGTATSSSGKKIVVTVGQGGLKFTPNIVQAAPGDTILFNWVSGKHNVVPSDSEGSCVQSTRLGTDPTLQALASGQPQTSGTHQFTVPANMQIGSSLYYYCAVGAHCSAGKMYGTINIVASSTSASGSGSSNAPQNVPSSAGNVQFNLNLLFILALNTAIGSLWTA